MVSNLKPDIVIVNKNEKTVSVFELTVPGEQRIEAANKLKSEKYEHLLTDIQQFKPTVTVFEIGSHTGFISNTNKKNLREIYTFCKPTIKLRIGLRQVQESTATQRKAFLFLIIGHYFEK